MIIIADSGATKTDWRVLTERGSMAFHTIGLSPYFTSADDLNAALREAFPADIDPSQVRQVHFYGSGCGSHEHGELMAQRLRAFFGQAQTHASSDALGSARALFGNTPGLVVILGTGSNVCRYDGHSLSALTPSLGFALGDEGSGAHIGRLLLRAHLYHQLPPHISQALEQQHDVSVSTVLEATYKGVRPSAYLASFAPFALANLHEPAIQAIVDASLNELYQIHLSAYPLAQLPVGITGSIGCLLAQRIDALAQQHGFAIARYVQRPIDALEEYHRNAM